MKKLLFFSAMVAMVSCSEKTNEISETPVEDKLPINITTSITRATDSSFEQNDKVGIYVVNQPNELVSSGNHVDNMRFTFSTNWIPDSEIYWIDKTTKADFYCYYPYSSAVSTNAHSFATKADQSTLANYKASEFLWGKTVGVSPTTNVVGIAVKHTFSNILITLKPGDGFTEESLAAANKSVKVCGVKTNATINLETGVATANGNNTNVIPYLEGELYRALIVPQTTTEGALIVVTVNGVDYTFTKGFTFKANTQHRFTVTVNKVNNGVNIGIGGWDIDETYNGGSAE